MVVRTSSGRLERSRWPLACDWVACTGGITRHYCCWGAGLWGWRREQALLWGAVQVCIQAMDCSLTYLLHRSDTVIYDLLFASGKQL